jgi:predicted RNA-binding protein with PIN domain
MRSLIIDGYNLAFAWNKVRPILLEDNRKGREKLLQLLSRYKKASRHDITVVFDGSRESSHPRQQNAHGIRLVYSRSPRTADDEIRRMLQDSPRKGSLLLVTSDREVAGFAKRRNIQVTGSAVFVRQAEETMEAGNREDSKPETGSLEEWLRLFTGKGNIDKH